MAGRKKLRFEIGSTVEYDDLINGGKTTGLVLDVDYESTTALYPRPHTRLTVKTEYGKRLAFKATMMHAKTIKK